MESSGGRGHGPGDRRTGDPRAAERPAGEQRAAHRERARPRGPIAGSVVAGVAVLSLSLLWAVGGLATEPDGPKKEKAGAAVDQSRFHTKVVDAAWRMHKNGSFGKPKRWLDVDLRVTNTSDDSVELLDYLKSVLVVQAWGSSLLNQYTATSGGSQTKTLQPGIATKVRMSLVPDKGNEHVEKVNVRLCGYEHRSDFFYGGHMFWSYECKNWQNVTQGDKKRKKNALDPDGYVAQIDLPVMDET